MHEPHRYCIVYGGRRSGKSFAVSQIIVAACLMYERHIVVSRKVATTMRNSVWARILGAISEAGVYENVKINKSDREISFENGSKIIFVGADNPEKLKSIEDITDWWLEEATEYTEMDFDTIDAGLSSLVVPAPRIFLTFNPIPVIEGVPHWIQKRFFSGLKPELGVPVVSGEAYILRTFFLHNAMCPEQNKKQLLSMRERDPMLWRMWGLGLFTRMRGAIIKKWDRVESVPRGVTCIGEGLDFGFAMDEAAVVRIWKRRSHEFWVKQLVYELELDNAELSDAMRYAGMQKHRSNIIADSAEPKSIKELRKLGWNVNGARKWPGFRREAALWARGCTIHVVDPSPKVAEEIAGWTWKFNQAADRFLPEPSDINNHTIDAFLYRAYREQESIFTRDDVSGAATDDESSLDSPDDELETDTGALFGGNP